MSATVTCPDARCSDATCTQDMYAMREWERFKWLARGLDHVGDSYHVAQLEALLHAAPHMPGQHEKVVVMLALQASPQALDVLESLDLTRYDHRFRALHGVALRYAKKRLSRF